MTAIMYDNNPVFRLMANITGYGVAIGYLAIVAAIAIVGFTLTTLPAATKVAFATMFTALCVAGIAAYVIGAYAIANAKVIALALAVIGTVALCAAMPQVALGGLLVLVFAEVTKK